MHGKKQTCFTFLSTEKVFSLSTFLTSTYFSFSCLLHLLFHCFDRTRNGWSTVTPTIVKNSRNIQQNPVNFPTKPSRSSILLSYSSGSHRSIYDSQSKTSERSSTDRTSCERDPNRQMRLVLRKGPNFNTHSCPFPIAGLAFVTKYLWARFVGLIFHFLEEPSVHFFPRVFYLVTVAASWEDAFPRRGRKILWNPSSKRSRQSLDSKLLHSGWREMPVAIFFSYGSLGKEILCLFSLLQLLRAYTFIWHLLIIESRK